LEKLALSGILVECKFYGLNSFDSIYLYLEGGLDDIRSTLSFKVMHCLSFSLRRRGLMRTIVTMLDLLGAGCVSFSYYIY
jgi:hypothetical protein